MTNNKAKLQSGRLSLEVAISERIGSRTHYQVWFLVNGVNIINPTALKRNTEYWKDRPGDCFLADDDGEDELLSSFIYEVINSKTEEEKTVETLDPDIIISIKKHISFNKPALKGEDCVSPYNG
jgi:hypothetical protein